MVDRGLRRPLPDNTAGMATWLDAREPSRGGDLTRKRSLVQIQYGPRHFSKSCLALRASRGARLLRFYPISAGHGFGGLTSARAFWQFWSVPSHRSGADARRVRATIQECRTSPTVNALCS